MATKSDLIEAQSFSRRRLLTAFVSGAPGGKELEPAAPLRAVFIGVALAVAVVLVGVFWGVLKPALPQGWENGRLVLDSDTGARYVTQDGVLHPVVNAASARLLIPSDQFRVISTDRQTLASVELGSTLGIVGAPDALPAPTALVDSGWTACVVADGLDVRIRERAAAQPTDGAVVVTTGTDLYVVAGDLRYAVAADRSDAILRAAGIAALDPIEVTTPWVNLFAPGDDLAPFTEPGAGAAVAGTDLVVGQVVRDDAETLYVVQRGGTLAQLSPLAWQLYQLGAGIGPDDVTDVSAAETEELGTSAQPAGGTDWPATGFATTAPDTRPCALLDSESGAPRTVLATQPESATAAAGVRVQSGHGALVRAGGAGDQSTGLVTLVDATGTAFPLPGATAETVARLGYTPADIGRATDDWIALLPTGPALTEEAAGRTADASGSASGLSSGG